LAGLVFAVAVLGVAAVHLAPVVGQALRGGDAGEVVPALEVEADRLAVEVGAVVELHALDQVERVLEAVVADVPGLGEQRCGVRGAGDRADEALEDLAGDAERLAVAGERGVERARVGGRREGERHLAAAGAAVAATGLAAAVVIALGRTSGEDERGCGCYGSPLRGPSHGAPSRTSNGSHSKPTHQNGPGGRADEIGSW